MSSSNNGPETYDKVQCFAYNLVNFFQETFNSCLDLVGNSELNPLSTNKNKESPFKKVIFGGIKAMGFFTTDILGTLCDILEKAVSKYEEDLLEQKKAQLSWFIHENAEKLEDLKKEIIKAAVEVFCHYEPQFNQVSVDGSAKKAMQILALEASFRLFSHLKKLKKNERKVLDKDFFVKCIVNAKGKTLDCKIAYANDDEKSSINNIKCVKLFDNVGVGCFQNTPHEYYKRIAENKSSLLRKNRISDVGYRNKFKWENLSDQTTWKSVALSTDEDDKHSKKFILCCDDELINKIEEYLILKNPFKELGRNLKEYHEVQMNNYENKHKTVMEKLNEIHSEMQR